MPNAPETTTPFPLTRWSLVLSSGAEDDGALEELCRLYWSPLYSFCRRSGVSAEDAEDLTQHFFHDLLKNRAVLLAGATPDAGRLRTLFLRVLQRRMADHHRHATREKRGGGTAIIPLDTAAAEAALQSLASNTGPEQVFDRQWALSVLQLALARLEKDYAASGRTAHFHVLVPFLGLTDAEPDYTKVREELGLGESTARQAVHRFRDRFRRHLRAEVAETISDQNESAIDAELYELRRALRGS